MLAIVSGFLHWRVELEGTTERIEVVSDYKALEYFMTTKALTARQACWAEVLACYDFRIMYKPGSTNCADALTRREQDTDRQRSAITSVCTKALLCPEHLDPRILEELENPAGIYSIDASPDISPDDGPGLDLIDSVLLANRTSGSLHAWREKAGNPGDDWVLENGLLKYQNRLVVPDEQELRTKLIAEAHNQVSTAHPGKNKTRQLLG